MATTTHRERDYSHRSTVEKLGLIDNKTCSIDDERSGIRFVVPRALRKPTAA